MAPRKQGSPPSAKAALPAPKKRARPTAPAMQAGAPDPVDASTLRAVFERFREADPAPQGELEHTNPFTLLVAVVLSAQATDAGVNKATRELFRIADTPQKMTALGEAGVLSHIKTLNFLNTKARNVSALARRLVDEFGGEVPGSVEVLETLPGVGRKSASVVANIAFREPRIAVDTHIFRVANRIPLVVASTPLETQERLEAVVPDDFKLDAHHWLILHGRYVCKARKPECWRCRIQDLCRYEPKTPAPASASGGAAPPGGASA